MKQFLHACFFVFFVIVLSFSGFSVTKYPISNGNWNTAGTWSPSGVPTSADDVVMTSAVSLTVNGNVSCKSFTMTTSGGSVLIPAGNSLTLSGDFMMRVNTTSNNNSVTVLGGLSVGGDVILQYNILLTNGGSNNLYIGNSANAAAVSMTGNLQFNSIATLSTSTLRSVVTFYHGSLNIGGGINFTTGLLSAINQALIIDDNTADLKPKTFSLGGSISGSVNGNFLFNDSNNNANYTVAFNGTTPQTMPLSNMTYKHVQINNPAGVSLSQNVPTNGILGDFRIKSGAVLDVSNGSLAQVNKYAGQLQFEAGSVLKTSNPSNYPNHTIGGLPVAEFAANAVVEMFTSSSINVLNGNFNMPILRLSGSGTKVLSSDIDDINRKIGEIQLNAGTLSIPSGRSIKLSASQSKLISIATGTTVRVQGDLANLDAFFDVHPTSNWYYEQNGNSQKIWSLKNSANAVVPYGNLFLERQDGNGNFSRDVAANDIVRIKGKLQLADKGVLNINQGAIVEFSTDATYTGYLAEIPSGSSISYNGNPSGRFVVRKQITYSNFNYRDFTSPVTGSTLRMLKNSGVTTTGFPGSNFPSYPYVNTYFYDETNLGTLNQGFFGPSSIDNPFVVRDNQNKILRSGYRIYTGSNTNGGYTVSDTGQVITGTQTYKLTFSHGTANRNLDDGWNFIGNPYPCAISWSKVALDLENVLTITLGAVRPSMYLWRPSETGVYSDTEDSYTFYNAVTGVASLLLESNQIPSFQGFWLKTYSLFSNSTSYEIKIKESHKSDMPATTFYKNKNGIDYNTLKLELALTQKGNTDKIWAHPYPEATDGDDPVFDVPRFGTGPNLPAINFTKDAESLNLWVNAFSDRAKQTRLPIHIFTPESGEAAIQINNTAKLLQDFGCIKLFDNVNGMLYSITSDTSIAFQTTQNYDGIRFVLELNRRVDKAVQLSDATCFEYQDGVFSFDLRGYDSIASFDLFHNGNLLKSYQQGDSLYVDSIGRGSYTLVNNLGQINCTTNSFDFTINSLPEVLGAFEAPSEWRQNQFVPIVNNSEGASSFIWTFSDVNFESSAQTPQYVFENPGDYTISLDTKNEFNCAGQRITKPIKITSTNAVSEIENRGLSWKQNSHNIEFNNQGQTAVKVDLFDLGGKLIDSRLVETNAKIEVHLPEGAIVVLLNIRDYTGWSETVKLSVK